MWMHKNCGICGQTMIEHFSSKDGTRLLICPSAKVRVNHSGIKRLPHRELYCDLTFLHPDIKPVPIANTTEESKAIEKAIKAKPVRNAFNDLLQKYYLEALIKSTYSIVDQVTLIESTNLALQLFFPIELIPKLFRSSVKLALALGKDGVKGVNSLVVGIGRQTPRVLDNIGVIFKQHQAFTWRKKELKVKKLTPEQKHQAWRDYAIFQVILKGSVLNDPDETTLIRFRAQIRKVDGQEQMGKIILGE
jgi:hypothetical protein